MPKTLHRDLDVYRKLSEKEDCDGLATLGETKSDATCIDKTESSREKTFKRRPRMRLENFIKRDAEQFGGSSNWRDLALDKG